MKLNRKWWWVALCVALFFIGGELVFIFQKARFFTTPLSYEVPSMVVTSPNLILPYPKIVSVTPADSAIDVVLDIEDPVVVRFDKSVKDFFIDFRLEPEVPVVYENNSGKTEFRLLPKEPLGASQKYVLKIYAKRRGESDEAYRKLGETSFTTIASQPEKWSTDLGKRLEEVRRFAHPLVEQGKYIDINLGNQTMVTFENGKLLDAYIISTGRRGMETPKGTFTIHNKALRPWSKAYNLYMPYWMAITADGKVGIHELPEWPSGYKEGANHLGTPVSHGCIRLGIGPAKAVWDWADVGTPVVVH